MDRSCLIVDLKAENDLEDLEQKASEHEFVLPLVFAKGEDEAHLNLSNGTIAAMVVFSDEFSNEMQRVLKAFQSNVGCLPDCQLVVCDEPNPRYLVSVFEFGVENFSANEEWATRTVDLVQNVNKEIKDESTTAHKSLKLSDAIRSGDQGKIQVIEENIKESAAFDFKAAFARGKALEAMGRYNDAVEEFSSAGSMNKMFRPSNSSLGESFLILGRVDEAIEIFQKLEKSNPRDVERKASLVAAYTEKGDTETAKKYLAEAEAIAPGSPKLLEAKALYLLGEGKVGEAFKLMDQLDEVGPFFAAKLNDLGIKLSKAGKGKSALALYQKAHKIVRPELKYKISLNAALACRRLNAFETALKYVTRCKKEYGSSYPKIEKIEKGLKDALLKQGKQAKPSQKAAS